MCSIVYKFHLHKGYVVHVALKNPGNWFRLHFDMKLPYFCMREPLISLAFSP